MTDHPAAVDAGTRLAVDRTRLAYERTMMAWVRTATSLISFGFTIYKFFQFEIDKGQPRADRLIGPRGFALIMIGIGLSAVFFASIEHRQSLKLLRTTYGDIPRSVSGLIGGLIGGLGLIALIVVILGR